MKYCDAYPVPNNLPGMNQLKVSIIISVYNGNEFLKDIEQYLEKQSFDDYEVLFVVDSRCNDGSLEEITKYCAVNEKARFTIQKERTKLGGAKNIGIEESRGKYLWFLDIDDIPSYDFLKIMVEAKESMQSDIAICNFQFTDDKSWTAPVNNELMIMSGRSALHARSLNLIPVTSWSMLYDKDLIVKNGIRFEEMLAEDVAFTYLSLNVCEKVCYVPAPIYGYYQNPNSLCKTNKDERGKSEFDSYLHLSKKFPKDDRYLQNRFCLVGMRSLAHMTVKGFVSMMGDERLKTFAKTYLTTMGIIEYRLMRIFPRIYHTGVNWYIKHFYCRVGRVYTDKGKMKTLKKIVANEKKEQGF